MTADPMPAASVPAKVFLFPHPDDEFAVSVVLRDLCRASDRVLCIYLTDGAFGGQSSAKREAESLAVLAAAGVDPHEVVFLGRRLGIPDGQLHLHLHAALDALAAVLPPCSELFCPAWEGGHQDHDAAHLLALALQRQCAIPSAWQFPLYHGAGLPGPFFRVMNPLPTNGAVRARTTGLRERLWHLRICMGYPSQWKTWVGLIPFVALHMALDGRFHMQPVCRKRILQSPHDGNPLYHRRGFLDHQAFRQATSRFIAEQVQPSSTPHQ